MKDNPLSGDHRNKVAAIVEYSKFSCSTPPTSSTTTSSATAVPPSTTIKVCPTSSIGNHNVTSSLSSTNPSSTSATNFDDDCNEWCDIAIGDLIIDLDADIEKNNVKICAAQTNGNSDHHHNGFQNSSAMSMSSQKSSRMPMGAVEHQATVDKGLKMKIKRKSVGSKSETKHEIVKTEVCNKVAGDVSGTNNCSAPSSVGGEASKSKHNSGKIRSGSHRDKKDKVKDKERSNKSGSSSDVNCVVSAVTQTNPVVVSAKSSPCSSSSSSSSVTVVPASQAASSSAPSCHPPTPVITASSCVGVVITPSALSLTTVASVPSTNCNQIISVPSSLTSPSVRIETPLSFSSFSSTSQHATFLGSTTNTTKQSATVVDSDHSKAPPPVKKMKYPDKQMMDRSCSPIPPEVKETSVGTSVGTITEPECLGPCEPGTSVTLEGIVWHETEGGVLVVNVTWRGKTYVGTLLDCTKHDWAPPRFCDSPTSDLDARTPKGRGKRGRGGSNGNSSDMSNFTETRASVHSKLRSNSKGRRGSNNNSSVPVISPAKGDNNNNSNSGLKRKGRPTDLEIPKESEAKAKRNRSASRSTPTSSSNSNEQLPQPSSPILIECPEPNCNKKYKHINGLKYHQSHAHQSGGLLPDGEKMQVDDGMNKDVCSDDEEMNDVESVKCAESEEIEKVEETESSKSANVAEVEPVLATLPVESKTVVETSNEVTNEVKSHPVVNTEKPVSAIPKTSESGAHVVTVPCEPLVTSAFVSTITTSSVFVPSGIKTSTSPAYLTSSPISSVTPNLLATPPEKLKPKVEKIDKNKLKMAVSARPIVPAPTPQVITLSANVNSPHLTSSASCCVTSTLKPIQPKPTILGEPTTVNPVLESLKKDKVKHKKKSRDKEKKLVTQQPGINREGKPVSVASNVHVSGVVDSKPKSTLDGMKDVNIPNTQTPQPVAATVYNPTVSSSSSSAVPLNCLDTSLDVNNLPVDSTANDNVQSPAYSDISDANDAPPAPPVLESEVNVKDKGDDKTGKSLSEQPSNLQPGFGLYPYYGQPPYLIPSVPPPPTNSSSTPVTSECNDEKTVETSSKDVGPSDKKSLPTPMTSSASSSNVGEYQQKFQQQFYPYSYPGYSFGVDAYRRMQLMGADSNFKQRFHEDQEHAYRSQADGQQQKESDVKIKSERENIVEKSSPLIVPASESIIKGITKPYQSAGKIESNSLKEKQNENHLILKENIELKSQMESHKPYDAKAPYLMERQRPEVRQYNYYQEKMMEEKKSNDSQRKKDEAMASDTSKISKPLELSTSRRQSPMTRLPTSSPKTMPVSSIPNSKDSVSQLQSFVKDLSKKDKSSENRKSEPKQQQEGQKPTMETTGPPLPNSYTYMHHPGSYLHPSPHYLSFDPTHPMYRQMNPMLMSPAAGYPGGPPTPAHYLPHQLRYDVPPSATPHSQPQMSPKRPQSIEHRQPTKALDLLQQHASQYYSSHKIQELQDRASKSPSVLSSSSPGTSTVSSNSRDKLSAPDSTSNKADSSATDRSRSPPTQRHLHTHHHTHVGVGYPLYDPYGGKLISKHPTEIAPKQCWKQAKPATSHYLDPTAGN